MHGPLDVKYIASLAHMPNSHSRGALWYCKWGSGDRVTGGITSYHFMNKTKCLFHGHERQWPVMFLSLKVVVPPRWSEGCGLITNSFLTFRGPCIVIYSY